VLQPEEVTAAAAMVIIQVRVGDNVVVVPLGCAQIGTKLNRQITTAVSLFSFSGLCDLV
jgi:hypothetical protein